MPLYLVIPLAIIVSLVMITWLRSLASPMADEARDFMNNEDVPLS